MEKLDLNYKQLSPYAAAFAVVVAGVVVGNLIFCKMVVKKKPVSTSNDPKK